MKNDILTKLNNKKKMWLTPRHPLYFESQRFKEIYGAAVFMHAGLNKTINTLNNLELERLLIKGFGMTGKEMADVIKSSQQGKRTIDEVISILDHSVKKNLFIMDLYSVSMRSSELSEEEKQSIDIFTELLNVSSMEQKKLREFVKAAFFGDKEQCIKIYKEMHNFKIELTMFELKYYMPELHYIAEIDNRIMKKGDSLRIVDSCNIKEDIILPIGTTLHISNANVNLYGTIIVDGGFLRISNSRLINKSKENSSLVVVKSFSEVEFIDSVFDCRNMGTVIAQNNGKLFIENCSFFNTSKGSAIKFWGNKVNIIKSQFQNCFSIKDGAAVLIKNGSGVVKECTFEDCEAKNGGAVCTADGIMFIESGFRRCRALKHGSGIFYKGEVKSNVRDCQFKDCYPENEEIVQYIYEKGRKVINKEYEINTVSIIDVPVYIEEMGILDINNTNVFLNKPIICKGILNIKNSKISVEDFEDRDMIVLVNSKPCNIENSQFDGGIKTGILRASGTKLYVKNSIFKNTCNGRAIYDALEPQISECIFSYCRGGGINSCGGNIKKCIFINCRDKTGAGISMFGLRGKISECTFISCNSEYSGGAVDRSRGHIIEKCNYEDCCQDSMI